MRSARTIEPTSLKSQVATNAVATMLPTTRRYCGTTTENWQWVKHIMFTAKRPQLRHAQRTQVVTSVVTCIVTQPFYWTKNDCKSQINI